MEENNHIYPIFDRMLMRKDKEDLLKQHSMMVWFCRLERLRQKYDSHCLGARTS